jgi:hypothetical protein
MQALPRMSGPLATTLNVAGLSTLIALALTILCLEREYETGRGRDALLLIYLPLIVPQISFMFGLQVLSIWLGVDASFGALVLAHLVFVLPYVFLSLSDPWRAHDRRHDQIAAGLGMSRRTYIAAHPASDADARDPDSGGRRVFGLGGPVSSDGADRRRAADHGNDGSRGAGGRGQPARDRRLCLHADTAAVFGFRHCNRSAGLAIPQSAGFAGLTMDNMADNEGTCAGARAHRARRRELVSLSTRVRRGETLTVMGPFGLWKIDASCLSRRISRSRRSRPAAACGSTV